MRAAALAIASVICIWGAGTAVADGGSIVSLSPDIDRLELYASPTAEKPEAMVPASELRLPTPILARSNNGMLKVGHNGAEFWVISDDVKTDTRRAVETACDPKMAGTIVAHGRRGAGEGCR